MKRIATGLLACTMALSLVACGGSQPAATDSKPAENNESAEVTDVALKVWAPQDDQPDANGWLPQMEAKFEAEHPEYKITWTNEVCGEDVAKDQVTKDPAAAADVYMFANDQLGELMAANGIAKLGGSYLEQVQADNSQAMVDSVTAPDGSVYGFPVAANTWFCYYNKDVYTEEDVKSLDTMLEKGVVAFPTKNSWYLGSFFFANGATAFGPNGIDAADGVKFGADNGVAALNAILDMVSNRWLPEKLQRTEIHPSRPWSCNPQRNPIQLRLFRQIAGHDLTKSGMGNGALPSDALPLPPVRRKAGGQAPDQTGRSCGRNPLVPAVSRTVWSDHAPAGHGPLGPPQSPIPQTLFWCRSRSLLLRSESTLHVFSLRIPDRTLL